MLNKNKRRMVTFIVAMAVLFVGTQAIQLLTLTTIINTYVSLKYAQTYMNVTVDMTKIAQQLPLWAGFVAVFFVIVELVVVWYISDGLDRRLKRRWPDAELINRRPTRKKAI